MKRSVSGIFGLPATMIYPLSKRSCFATTKDGHFFQGHMGRTVNKLTL
jgi:hypothetical protein